MFLVAALLVADPAAQTATWLTCLQSAGGELSVSDELAETVAVAAFGQCQTEEDATRSAWLPSYLAAYGPAASGDPIGDLKERVRERLISDIVSRRVTRKSAR